MRLLSRRAVLLRAAPRPSLPRPSSALQPPEHLNSAEADIFATLSSGLTPTALEVQDISGGCGSMYALSVTSEKFRGLSTVKRHRLVNEVLKGRVEKWHGLQVRCYLPEGK
ncbi:hypothetical protein ANO11243_087430 [Dothideomycetidae sp. 11243]|nr:hypothetical protein ANO11243_087430 [fungal sp. No.11243]